MATAGSEHVEHEHEPKVSATEPTLAQRLVRLAGERKLWAYCLALLGILAVSHSDPAVAVSGITWCLAAFCGGNALSYLTQGKKV